MSKRTSYRGQFSGWEYTDARALGYSSFNPEEDHKKLAEAIMAVFNLYRPQGLLPLGPRGVGYRLEHQTIADRLVVKGLITTGKGATEATRQHYGCDIWTFKDIGEVLVSLRRARFQDAKGEYPELSLPWAEVDDGRTIVRAPMVAHDLAEALRSDAESYSPDLLFDQDWAVELWIEAQGGFGLWTTIAYRWGVPVYSGSGMAPVAAAQAAASRWTVEADHHPKMLVVLVTDCDPAGYVIADRFAEESGTFVAQYGDKVQVKFVRLALTEDQVARSQRPNSPYRIEWGPRKTSHGKVMPRTAEAEALPPEVARDLFDALMRHTLNQDGIEATRAAWEAQVSDVLDRLAS